MSRESEKVVMGSENPEDWKEDEEGILELNPEIAQKQKEKLDKTYDGQGVTLEFQGENIANIPEKDFEMLLDYLESQKVNLQTPSEKEIKDALYTLWALQVSVDSGEENFQKAIAFSESEKNIQAIKEAITRGLKKRGGEQANLVAEGETEILQSEVDTFYTSDGDLSPDTLFSDGIPGEVNRLTEETRRVLSKKEIKKVNPEEFKSILISALNKTIEVAQQKGVPDWVITKNIKERDEISELSPEKCLKKYHEELLQQVEKN